MKTVSYCLVSFPRLLFTCVGKSFVVFEALCVLAACLGLDATANPGATPRQTHWQSREIEALLHFGPNTFTGRELGLGTEPPSTFNPTALNCDQWVSAAKSFGVKTIIFTAKHHDGFCLWPSAVTEYSVKNSPWKDGKGDVLKELAEACKSRQGAESLEVTLRQLALLGGGDPRVLLMNAA